MNQRNVIIFTVYQQFVGNVIAMHRDAQTPKMIDRWPRWYRKTYVDGGDADDAAEHAQDGEVEAWDGEKAPMPAQELDIAGGEDSSSLGAGGGSSEDVTDDVGDGDWRSAKSIPERSM